MREKGYDDMPSDTDEKSCATKHAEDNFNLLSGLAKGFKHRRAQCQNQMRKLIHVPARECPEVACSRRVSFVQGEMMPQGHPYYGYGYGHDPLYSDGYTASQLGGSISTPDMAMFPPTYPRMRMMAQQQPTVYHYNSFIPVESLPALQEATAPAAANIENEDLFNYPLDGDLFATEGDPFATSDDEDIEDVTPLDLKVFHEVPLSDVQKALHINPNV